MIGDVACVRRRAYLWELYEKGWTAVTMARSAANEAARCAAARVAQPLGLGPPCPTEEPSQTERSNRSRSPASALGSRDPSLERSGSSESKSSEEEGMPEPTPQGGVVMPSDLAQSEAFLEHARAHIDEYMRTNLPGFAQQCVAGLVAPIARHIAEVKEEQAQLRSKAKKVGKEASQVCSAVPAMDARMATGCVGAAERRGGGGSGPPAFVAACGAEQQRAPELRHWHTAVSARTARRRWSSRARSLARVRQGESGRADARHRGSSRAGAGALRADCAMLHTIASSPRSLTASPRRRNILGTSTTWSPTRQGATSRSCTTGRRRPALRRCNAEARG